MSKISRANQALLDKRTEQNGETPLEEAIANYFEKIAECKKEGNSFKRGAYVALAAFCSTPEGERTFNFFYDLRQKVGALPNPIGYFARAKSFFYRK